MSEARRRFGRFDRELPVELSVDGETYQARTVNIGLGGMQLDTELDLPYDAPVQFRLRVPRPEQVVEATARVIWSQAEGRRGVGVAFDALRPIDVWALLQYFNLSATSPEAALLE